MDIDNLINELEQKAANIVKEGERVIAQVTGEYNGRYKEVQDMILKLQSLKNPAPVTETTG